MPAKRDLLNYLLLQTQIYLTMDNPERVSAKDKFAGLFSRNGAVGRARVLAYRTRVLYTHHGSRLLDTIIDDIYNGLGTSKTYRLRLMLAVCNYYQVDDEQINKLLMKKNLPSQLIKREFCERLNIKANTDALYEVMSAVIRENYENHFTLTYD